MTSRQAFDRTDQAISRWMAVHGVTLLRWSIGVVFVWFGALKLVPGLSPADRIATDTSMVLTFDLLTEDVVRIGLAALEMTIGIGLLTGRFLRFTLLLLYGQMAGTFTPMIIFPELVWTAFPFGLTLVGQYIIKNGVLISAGIVIGATVRGGRLIHNPDILAVTGSDRPSTTSRH